MTSNHHNVLRLSDQDCGQLDLFVVHRLENNVESQMNLDENREHFSNKCRVVFDWLMGGKEITVLWAANNGVASLPRRIKDLKQKFMISDRWRDGVKVYYMSNDDREHNKNHKA